MAVSKRLSIVIMDYSKIHDINQIIIKYSNSASPSSSHILFDVEPVNLNDVAEDLTFFRIAAEDEESLDDKLNELIEDLNQVDTDYSIRNMETGEFYTTIASVGAIYIKFDNVKVIPEGTYEKIDELKNMVTEFGYCKGYKPPFRPLEGKSIEKLDVKSENIYLFATPSEDMPKLIEYMTGKIAEIDSDFIIESKIFIQK